MNFSEQDIQWMQHALTLAQQSQHYNEVPVGALITVDNELIASAHNLTIKKQNACAHAEILALEKAFKQQNNYRLQHATLYVTLEPCCMCAGAIIHARLEKVIFGAFDKRVGAAGSVFNILGDPRQYHQPQVIGGCLKEQSEELLSEFFAQKRNLNKAKNK